MFNSKQTCGQACLCMRNPQALSLSCTLSDSLRDLLNFSILFLSHSHHRARLKYEFPFTNFCFQNLFRVLKDGCSDCVSAHLSIEKFYANYDENNEPIEDKLPSNAPTNLPPP